MTLKADSAGQPSHCPFCRSGDLRSIAQGKPEDAYWRCVTCGQIWNPARLRPPRPVYPGRKW